MLLCTERPLRALPVPQRGWRRRSSAASCRILSGTRVLVVGTVTVGGRAAPRRHDVPAPEDLVPLFVGDGLLLRFNAAETLGGRRV